MTSDAAGNLTQDRAARKLAYDAQGRLQSVSLDGQQVAEYRYNALGQRIVKLTPESVTTYLYGPDGQLLGEAEHDGSGRKLRAQYYLWLDSLPLATIDADYDAQGKVGNPTLLYLHGDHLDTPRLATDASGQIAWQWQSDAFGRGEALSQGSTQVNLRFPGQYYDAESGLHYNYFRDYDPETGRYVESDPVETLRKLNNPEMTFLNSGESMLQATPYWEHGFTPNHNYTYSDNNPTAKSDKHGLSPNPTDNLIYTPDTNCTCTLECKKKFTGNGKSFLVGALCSKATTPFFGGVVCNSTIVMICGASCSQECNRAPSCEKKEAAMSSLYNIIAVLCAITLVVLELKRTTFIRTLKKEEPNAWEKLGRPSGYFLSYLVKIDGFKLEKFIFRKQYNALENNEIRKIGRQLLYLQSTFLTLIIALIALMILQFTIKN